MELLAADSTATKSNCASSCAVVELRQYTLYPGKRDTLISLFEREFVDPLEAAGMTVMGQFHDLDRPDRFVWMRGFRDMYRRAQGLAAFYGGPIWHAHRESANETMLDSDNVLLLRPARAGGGITLPERRQRTGGINALARTRVVVTINPLARPADARRIEFFDSELAPLLVHAGARLLGTYVTESSANNFPRLPLREGEHVFVWFASFADDVAYERFRARLDASPEWHEKLADWKRGLVGAPEVLRLAPTISSLING
jgi:hypothetical protein